MFLRKLALMNPVQFLASHAIKILIRRFNLPNTLLSLFTVLYHTSYRLIRSHGIYQVFKLLFDIKKFVGTYRGDPATAYVALREFLGDRHSPLLIHSFIREIIPYLHSCLPVDGTVYVVFNYFFVGLFTTVLKPVIKYSFKVSLGLILGSLGIIWNESLSSITYLKDFSVYILDTIESYSNFRFPKINLPSHTTTVSVQDFSKPKITTNTIPVDFTPVPEGLDSDYESGVNKTSYIFSFLGVALLGITASIGILIITDHYAHETVQNVPLLHTITESVYSIWDSVTNYFSTNVNVDSNDSAGAISRVSSTDSTKTITNSNIPDQVLTPPASRPVTPVPDDSY